MKAHIHYFLTAILMVVLSVENIHSQDVKPRLTAIQSVQNSPYGVANSDEGYWNNPYTWDWHIQNPDEPPRIPTHGDTIVIPDGITVKVVLNVNGNKPDAGTSNNRLSNAVIIVQNGGGLTWHPVLPGPVGQGEKMFLECNSTMHVEPEGWLWGDQVGDKISYCNSFVWSGDGNQNFGPYTWGNWLPVELMFFKAEVSNGDILLRWSTLSETNNDFFVIEKGNSAHDFNVISAVPGSGNSNVPLYYSYRDHTGSNSTVYYRLSQYDYDGTSEIIGLLAIEPGMIQKQELLMFQNPVMSDENVDFILLKEVHGKLSIFTPGGKQIFSCPVLPSSGKIHTGNLLPGLYFVVIETDYSRESYKLVVI